MTPFRGPATRAGAERMAIRGQFARLTQLDAMAQDRRAAAPHTATDPASVRRASWRYEVQTTLRAGWVVTRHELGDTGWAVVGTDDAPTFEAAERIARDWVASGPRVVRRG